MTLRSLRECVGMRVKFTNPWDDVIEGTLYYDKEMKRWSINCGTSCPGFCEKGYARNYRVNDKAEIAEVKRRVA